MPSPNKIRIFSSITLLLVIAAFSSGCARLTPVHDTEPKKEIAENATAEEAAPAVEPEPAAETEVQAGICTPPPDLWHRIRKSFALTGEDHPQIATELKWFARHQGYLDRIAERAAPYLYLVVDEIEQRGMPTEIALLPIVESAFEPFAYSHGRAAGLWQFIPGTGRRFGLKQTWWYDGRRDVAQSTRAAADYLKYLNETFDGDWLLALAAYNSGEGTVQRAIRRNRRQGKPTDFWSLALPKETRGYVPKLLAISSLVKDPEAHGVSLPSIPDAEFLTEVNVGSQIDLALAAELAGISLEDLYRYNPAFNRWATDPEGPHSLLVPVANAEHFRAKLAEHPQTQRVAWKRHKIKSGESLGGIAREYRTTVSLLREVNDIRGNTIRAGHSLVIPVARRDLSQYSMTASQRKAATQDRVRSGSKVDYDVRSGDTLWNIARKYDVSVRSLAKWNAMAPGDTLRPGQRLVIWTKKAEKVSRAGPADFVHPFEDKTRRRIGYKVRRGDSLSRISQRFRVAVDDLIRWNKLHNKKYLQPGQTLTLYVDVRRQSGKI